MLVPCSECGRHIRQTDASCPFCEGGRPGIRRILNVFGAVMTPLVLAACYGAPPGELEDLDHDGYTNDVDCNDDDATINPGADEACDDGVDNDCDGDIDEGCGDSGDSGS